MTKTFTVEEAKAILQEVADIIGGRLRTTYSGRCMYGAQCLGIDCDDDTQCLKEAAAHGIRGGVRDSMGLGYIVYWPQYQTKEGRY
jgi:hypothetical protein